MPTNAAAEVLPSAVLKIIAIAEKAEDVLFEKQEDIRNMERSLDYAVQRHADLADQHVKAPVAEKKHFVLELAVHRTQIIGMKKQLAVARGQATKLQHRINEIRQKAREVLQEIRATEVKKSVTKGK